MTTLQLDQADTAVRPAAPRTRSLDPVLMMLAALALVVALTWLVPSGVFERGAKGTVIPGTFHVIDKPYTLGTLLGEAAPKGTAAPASPAAIVTAIPRGMVRASGLIFMIGFLGGMFGVLRATGALDAGIDRLLGLTGGRIWLTVPVLMVAISAGSSFLGLISEYLLIIPMMQVLSRRLGLGAMFGFAMVAVPAKIGNLAAVANPISLVIAQPLAGVPLFSGMWLRALVWVAYLAIGIAAVLRLARGAARVPPAATGRLPGRQMMVLLVMAAGVGLLVAGTLAWSWRDEQIGAFYIALGVAVAAVSGMRAREAAHAFVDGVRSMALAGLLVGMAAGVEVILRDGVVLDSIIAGLASLAAGLPAVLVGAALMAIEMVLTLLIPSTAAKAALSMPILVPIAGLSGVSGQTTVLAFLLGNGLVNMFAPTSGMLLAYLATAGVPFGAWVRWVGPLFGLLALLSFGVVMAAVAIGY